MRVGLVGARRVRQGLGPYLARFLEDCGARVSAFAGRNPEALATTARDLEVRLGHPVRGYLGHDEMITVERERGEGLDALVIASPIGTHRKALLAACRADLHVLCEKPMVWEGPGSTDRAREIVDAFERAGLLLKINVQWPYTLDSYYRLFPDRRGAVPHSFYMLLCPGAPGPSMLAEAVHHPASLLQAVLPGSSASVEKSRVALRTSDETALELAFDYVTSRARVECRVDLRVHDTSPRPAAYGFDGRIAHRTIRLPGYELSFSKAAAGGEQVPVPDPTPRLVADFCRALRDGPPYHVDSHEVERVAMLEALMESYPFREDPSS